MNHGKIIQVSGPVVDVEFEAGHLPKIREALTIHVDGQKRVMEVAQHIGNDTVRCPDGFVFPKSILAMELPSCSPAYHCIRIAGMCFFSHAIEKGLPVTRTKMTGFPVA